MVGIHIICFYEDGYIYVREKEIALFRGTGLCGFFHKAKPYLNSSIPLNSTFRLLKYTTKDNWMLY